MAFTKVDINEVIEEKKRKDPEFKKKWDDSREEHRSIEDKKGETYGKRKGNYFVRD